MGYTRLKALEETGYVVLDMYDQSQDPKEWLDIEYVNWKSSGVTRFSPLTSAFGEMECNGFWNHTPPRTDKDGVWVEANVAKAPKLVERAMEPGANIGRCRVIELQPNEYGDALYNMHQDDNNRLNPDGTGWIVRAFFQLTDNPDSVMILREDRFDPATEMRLALPAGTQLVLDTQRFWHSVWHNGNEPRYCLITSYESGPELEAYIEKYHGKSVVPNFPVSTEVAEAAEKHFLARVEARNAALAAQGIVDEGVKDPEA